MARSTNRQWRVFLALVLGMAFVCLLLVASARAQQPDGKPVNLDVILLIDNSMSMSQAYPEAGEQPSDPEELRIRAAKFLVDYLRANAEIARANYRVGVVSFGGELGGVVPLRMAKDDAVQDGIRAEQIDYTDFHEPLQYAFRELRAKSFGTGNKMAVILFTDGRPHLEGLDDTDEARGTYFDDLAPLVNDLQEEGASLYVLGIGDARKDRGAWRELVPQKHYVSISNIRQLVGIYHGIVTELIGIAAEEEGTVPDGERLSVDVQPYLESIVFSFVKSNPDIGISLTTPSGISVDPVMETADHHTIYALSRPEAGQWSVVWEGEGEVRYWVDRRHPRLRVDVDKSEYQVQEPITVGASLTRNGETVQEPLHLEASIEYADGSMHHRVFSHTGEGRYQAHYDGLEEADSYTLTVAAYVEGEPLQTRSDPVLLDVVAPPAPALVPSATPAAAAAELTPTPTPAPTATDTGDQAGSSQPEDTWFGGDRPGWALVLLGLVGLVGLGVGWIWWKLRRPAEDGSRLRGLQKPPELASWIGRVQEVSAPDEALFEFRRGLDAEKKRLEPIEKSAVRKARLGTVALYQRFKSKGEPIDGIFEALAEGAAYGNDAIREGVAEAFVHILTAEGNKRLLESYLHFTKSASEYGRAADEISDTLHKAAVYASEKSRAALKRIRSDDLSEEKRADLLLESKRYDFISSFAGTYAGLWLRRDTHTVDIRELFRRAGGLLESPFVQGATFRDEMHRLYHGLYEMLGDIQFSEDAVPLHLPSASAAKPDEIEARLQMALGGYGTAGIAAVLKHLVNQPLYPLEEFLDRLGQAEEALAEQVAEGALMVPDEVILRFLVERWRDAARADVGHKRAALSLELVNDRAFWREEEREATFRVAIQNAAERARIGRAEDVSVSVGPPLTGYTVDPFLGLVSVILPWETGVTYDIVVQLPSDQPAGKLQVPLEVAFTDLAEGRSTQHCMVEVEVLDPAQAGDELTYDPLTEMEIERLTGGREPLRKLIDRTIADLCADSRVVYPEDLEAVVAEVMASPELEERFGWARLSEDGKAAVRALGGLLGSGMRAHVKAVEIRRRLMDTDGDRLVNWNRVIKDLVGKRIVEEEEGLYSLRGELFRRWVVEQEGELVTT